MSCSSCVQRQPVVDLRQLHRGDHIEFGRINFIKPFLRKLVSGTEHIRFGYLYFHHAIVTEVNHVGQYIKLVEFGSNGKSLSSYLKSQQKAIVRESQMNFHDLYDDLDIFLVIHKNKSQHPPNPHEIVKNALGLLQKARSEKYNLFFNNCEYLANLCVTEQRVSMQIREATDGLINGMFVNKPTWFKTLLKTLWKMLLTLISKVQEILKNYPKLHEAFVFMARYLGKWLGCTFAIAIIFTALKIFIFYYPWKDHAFCSDCFKVWVINLSLQLLSMLLSAKCMFLVGIGICFSGFLPYEFLFRNRTDYSQLHSLRTIRPGDVITFNLYIPFSFYDAIVVDWELLLTAGNMRKLTRPFSTLSEEEVFGLLTSLLDEFLRIERKKSIENLDIYVKDTSEQGGNSVLESVPYQKMNEFLSTPRLCFRKENGRWKQLLYCRNDCNTPIVIALTDGKHIKLYHDLLQTYHVEIVHYDLERGLKFPDILFPSARVVKFETTTLSIGTKHDVYKKKLVESEAYRNVPKVTIQNALDMIGEQKWSLFGKWSSDFATECVIVDLDRYYNRGYRFARLVQSQCFDLFYGETLRRCQDFGLDRISFQESGSGLERISYLINFLMKFPRKRKA